MIDIIYDNIKYAFFQPAEKSLIVVVHFHLHSEIMVGKKKTQDVQFYLEVMEASLALGQAKSSRWYPFTFLLVHLDGVLVAIA